MYGLPGSVALMTRLPIGELIVSRRLFGPNSVAIRHITDPFVAFDLDESS